MFKALRILNGVKDYVRRYDTYRNLRCFVKISYKINIKSAYVANVNHNRNKYGFNHSCFFLVKT
jgi:hypothetical protein